MDDKAPATDSVGTTRIATASQTVRAAALSRPILEAHTAQVNEQIDRVLVANKAPRQGSTMPAENTVRSSLQQSHFDLAKVVPTVVMRNEDYGRISPNSR
jgi:hypothetical protein